MGHSLKSGSHLEQLVTLGKWVTLGKMDHAWKRWGDSLKNGSQFEKVYTSKNGSQFKKKVTFEQLGPLGIVGHTWKNGSYLENGGSHMEKWVILEGKGQTWRNVLHLQKSGHT